MGGCHPPTCCPASTSSSESAGPPGYAARAWTCTGATSFTDTTVTVALDQTVVCTINNDDIAATLSLDKVVTNNNGGTADETDWTLTATPDAIVGQGPVTGVGGATHRCDSPAPTPSPKPVTAGYAASAWTCTGATSFTDTTVTVALGQTVVCTINNDDIAATLSLDKVVTNNNGGTADETDWTLTATPDAIVGQGPITGVGGVPPTDVLPGTYTLTETGDVPGYAASAWTCVGPPRSPTPRSPSPSARPSSAPSTTTTSPPSLSLVKTVTNDNLGGALPTDWTLTATPTPAIVGQDPVTGPGGVAPTDVLPGTYTLTESTEPCPATPR